MRRLRRGAGNPGYRELARRVHYSATTLAEAAAGNRLPTLAVTLAYVRGCGGDVTAWEAHWHSAAAELDAVNGADRRPPYLGLAVYAPQDADRFFGRERMLAVLVERLGRQRFVAVVGASGSGKSSLLRAGLLPSLAADDRFTLLFTPGSHPLRECAVRLGAELGLAPGSLVADLNDHQSNLGLAMRQLLLARPPGSEALLVVDQFEEVFTLCADAGERERFIAALAAAASDADNRVRVVLGLRADFYAHCARLPVLVEVLQDAQVMVKPMNADELRDVVTRPATGAGLTVEDGLVATILAEAGEQPGALPFVSHALWETWQNRSDGALTLADYHARGGVRGAIAQTAEREFDGFGPAERQAARRIFLRLIALGDGTEDTRRPIDRAELDGVADPPVIAGVLDRLVEARLVVLDEDTVEVAHEALIRAWPRLNHWLTEDRADLLVHRRLTEAALIWDSLERDQSAVYRGAQLAAAAAWAERHPEEPNLLEQAFLRAGHELREAEERTARHQIRLLRRLLTAMAVLLVLALVGGVAAIWRGVEARNQQVITLARHLSGESRLLSSSDPDLAALLAITAFRLNPDADSRGSLLSAAAVPRRVELDSGSSAVYHLAFNQDATLLASGDASGNVILWSPVTRTKVAAFPGRGGYISRVAFSDDGTLLAAASVTGAGGLITVWDVPTRRKLAERTVAIPSPALALSPDGATVAVGATNGDIALWDWARDSWAAHGHSGRPKQVRTLTFSPDGQLLVSVRVGEKPVVLNATTFTKLAELDADEVHALMFAPTGRTLATASYRGGVRLWDLDEPAAPKLAASLPAQPTYAWSISAPVHGKIAVADENGTVNIWDTTRREVLCTYQDRGLTETVSLALSRDGTTLASSGFGRFIALRTPVLPPFAGHATPVNDLAADGRTIASAGDDGTVRLWDPGGRQVAVLPGHDDQLLGVALSGNGRLLAALARDHAVTLWDVDARRRHGSEIRFSGFGASTDVALDTTGDRIAVASLYRFLWHRGIRVSLDPAVPRTASAVAFSPDGRLLVSASPTGRLVIRDLTTSEDGKVIETGQGALQDVAISPDGRLAATAGADRTVKLWSLSDGGLVATLSGHSKSVSAVSFSRDGRRLASAGEDQTVLVWDIRSGQRTETLSGHQSAIRSLAFTADGSLIAGADDGRIIRWGFDTEAAVSALCAAIGRDLTERERQEYGPSIPREPTC
ncbi:hypothetical protein Aple_025150 [Acrocarpospora pleiomorpha]|uniref:Novel STAND NTPase 1 domain-containing protein n=1 Tax=Acrocarpospora pleiomorpha TaxID=90975 RepID=A0A5M3XHD7_9ACTN|nr:hypothetical protein Aple_025150 [Acrocarpospora pleiomorpha]